MVCSTAILSASLALSLLRHGLPPEMPAVISPYSLATALSIVHDGSNGTTQQELANLLLNGLDQFFIFMISVFLNAHRRMHRRVMNGKLNGIP